MRRKGLRCAALVCIGGRFRISVAIRSFHWKSDVGVRALPWRSLIAIPEEEPVLIAKILVDSREPLVLVGDDTEILGPVGLQRRRDCERWVRVISEDLPHQRIDAVARDCIAFEYRPAKAALLGRIWHRGQWIVDLDQSTRVSERLREIAGFLKGSRHVRRGSADAMIVYLFPVEEEEGLVPPVVNVGEVHRAGQRKPVFFVPLPAPKHVVPVIAPTVGIQLVLFSLLLGAAVQLIAAGLSRGNQNSASRTAVFGRKVVRKEPSFLHGLLRRSIGVVESRIVSEVLPLQ